MNERDYYGPDIRRPDRDYGEGRYEQGRSRFSRLFGGEPRSQAPRGGSGTVIYSPSTYEDVCRILDFMSGAIYALSGSIQQINKNIFLFAPSGVTITVPPHIGRR